MYTCELSVGHSLLTLSRMPNNQTVLRIKKLGTEFPVEQTNVNIRGLFTLYNTAIPQTLRRVQISDGGDFADLRDNGELVFSLGAGNVLKEFDLTAESCRDAMELYAPRGLSQNIVLLITCRDGRVLCAKYSNGEYSIDSIFVSQYTSSTPVIVTNNGVSTAIYTVVVEEISALAIRSLEPNSYEQFMYVDTFEETFGSCTETLSYNATHVRLLCSNTHDFYLVDGIGATDGRKICPQGMGDLVNIYNEDMILVVSSSFVTINTIESTNFCTLDLPTPVTRVDYARVNGKLLLLFFSYQVIYQYDTSTSCVNENLVTLVNATLLGLNGDYQNYIIFGDLLVYTVMKNGLFLSRGIDLSTSQDLGVFANHQNYPLLYGIIYDNDTVTMPTNTVITTSSELIIPTLTSSVLTSTSTTSSSTVTMTTNSDFSSNPASTSSALTSSNAVTMTTNSVFSSASISTPLSISITTSSSFISTSAFSTTVTMTTATPFRTNSENIESEPSESMDSLPFVLGIISIIILVCITVSCAVLITIILLWCCYRYRIKKKSSTHPTCKAVEAIQNNLQPSSANSSNPQLDTNSVGSTDYITPIQAQQTSCSSLPVNPSEDQNTDKTSTLPSCLSLDRIQSSREEQQYRNTKYQSGQLDVSHDKKDSLA